MFYSCSAKYFIIKVAHSKYLYTGMHIAKFNKQFVW